MVNNFSTKLHFTITRYIIMVYPCGLWLREQMKIQYRSKQNTCLSGKETKNRAHRAQIKQNRV